MTYTVSNYQLTNNERSNRIVAITFQKTVDPPNKYENRKIYPYRTFYGYATFLNQSWVMAECQLEFDNQVIYYWESPEQQLASEAYEKQEATVYSIKAHFDVLIPDIKMGALLMQSPTARQCIACPIDNFYISVVAGCQYNVNILYEPIDAGSLTTINYRMLQLP